MMTSFDNNEDKVCSLLKDDVGGLRIRSYARSHDLKSCDHGVTTTIRFKWIIWLGHMQPVTFRSCDNELQMHYLKYYCELNQIEYFWYSAK